MSLMEMMFHTVTAISAFGISLLCYLSMSLYEDNASEHDPT